MTLTSKEKLEVFEKHLNYIENKSIKNFTEFCLFEIPEYFWTLPASTSGTRHKKNQSLVDHVNCCLDISDDVIRQFENHWTQNQKDQLISSLILHDSYRCGAKGDEFRYTEESIIEKNLDRCFIGTFRSINTHPEIGYQELLKLSVKFNKECVKNKKPIIGARNLEPILKGVRYHYGPWTKTDLKKPFSLSWPFDSVVVQVHNIDFMDATISKRL
jgi:hypothetical protein